MSKDLRKLNSQDKKEEIAVVPELKEFSSTMVEEGKDV